MMHSPRRPSLLRAIAMALAFLSPCSHPAAQERAGSSFRSADLPPLLRFSDGKQVVTPEDWKERRAEIADLWQDTYLGRFPPVPPRLLEAEDLRRQEREDGVVVRDVRLVFDTPKKRTSFEIRLLLPKREIPGRAGSPIPREPLLLTQPRRYQLAWGEAAVRRGYITCYYPGVDYNHREAAFPGYEKVWRAFQEQYPEAGWHSSLAIQGWLAGRALDYLLSDKFNRRIDRESVGIIGHSRYGKQSLYAAAFDARIKAVVARSAGSPAAAGYRFTGRETFMETVRDAPAEWALPRLARFFGREHELPVESNGLLAMIAPRACLLHTAYNDGSDPTFAVERTYRSAKKVYRFLGAPERLALQYRSGNHNPVTAAHVRANLDWLDWSFGRGEARRRDFPERLLHAFDWSAWKRAQDPEDLTVPGEGAPLKERVLWSLGQRPAEFSRSRRAPLRILREEDHGVSKWSRDRWKPAGVSRLAVSFGANVHGNLMFPDSHDGPLPVVVWLHPFNYSHGANEGYGVEGTAVYYRLAQAGYAVLCFDQCGFGDRLLEGAAFYEKYPRWSKLGRMVFDVRSAIDFLRGGHGLTDGEMPALDADNLTLLGYSLGGMVALHAAALDDRVSRVASFCGFTPMRTDGSNRATGGIRRWWEWHALQPKLGLFDGREASIPYDYEDLFSALAAKDCLVYSAREDRHVHAEDVASCMARVRSRDSRITFVHARDVNRFQSAQHQVLLDWLKRPK